MIVLDKIQSTADRLEKRRKKNRDFSIRRYVEFRKKLDNIKLSSGCIDCGFNLHPAALHFDHREPKLKRCKVAAMCTFNWSVVLEEITKCDIRCANCHSIKTFVRGENGRGSKRKS